MTLFTNTIMYMKYTHSYTRKTFERTCSVANLGVEKKNFPLLQKLSSIGAYVPQSKCQRDQKKGILIYFRKKKKKYST
jgi:hypothetical protein